MLLTIMDGAQLLEVHDCPTIQLPDGRPGAIWRGLAFALLPAGDAIDVSLDGVPPALCRSAGSERRATPEAGFAIEAGDDDAYVLLPGSGLEANRAARRLQEAGLQVLRTGRHYGDPAGGTAADWFVKVVLPDGPHDLTGIVSRALGVSPTDRPATLDRADVLKSELLAARSREAAAREEVARLRLALGDRDSASAKELAALRADLAEESALRTAAEAEALRAALASSLPVAPIGRVGRAIRDEICDVFETLLPNLRPLRDTLDVLAKEFRDRRSVYRVLRQLASAESGRPAEGKWKTLASLRGDWIESHVANGSDDAGRVYAKLDASDRHWSVLLSHKGQQTRDVAWLKIQG